MAAMNSDFRSRATERIRNRIDIALFITIAALSSVAWVGNTWAQTDIRRVGILTFFAIEDEQTTASEIAILRSDLAGLGWIEGKNVEFEYRSAKANPENFAEAAADLVRQKVDLIWAVSAPALRATHAATRTIPIVAIDFTTDPIAEGYIQSYARPGGNITGIFLDAPEFAGKWFELLRAVIPNLSRVSVLWDPSPGTTHLRAVRGVAQSLDIELQVLEVKTPNEIDAAFDALQKRPQALIALPSPMFWYQSARQARLALQYQLPATSMADDFVISGGAISYGPETTATGGRNAVLVAKILDGAKPGDIPVERPTKIQLMVNLKTAKTLDITIPQSILLRADAVIK